MSTIGTSRNVNRRNNHLKLTAGSNKLANRPSKAKLMVTARKLNRTKTRRFVLYGLGCVVLMQILRYLSNEVIFAGPTTPGGIGFLLFFYIQTGLMLAFLGFLIAAAITYLRSLGVE